MSKEKFFDLVELSNSSPSPFEGEKKYISTGDVDDNGINLNTAIDITYDNRPTRANVQCKPGDVLIAKMAETNKVILIDDINSNYIYSTGFLCVTPKLNRLTSRCLYYLVTCPQFLIQKDKQSAGSTQKAINNKWFSKIFVEIPDLSEQDSYTKILDKMVLLSQRLKKCLNLCDLLVKSQFSEMFGNIISNDKHWSVYRMKDVSPIRAFKGNVNPIQEDKFWLLNLDVVEAQTGQVLSYNFVPINEIGSSTIKFSEDNILYSKLRPYLNKVVEPHQKGYATSELIPLLPNPKLIDKTFFAYLLRTNDFVTYISNKVQGSKMPRVSMGYFKEFQVVCPPLDTQHEFASFVNQIDKTKFKLKQLQEKLDALYKSLLQKYFG